MIAIRLRKTRFNCGQIILGFGMVVALVFSACSSNSSPLAEEQTGTMALPDWAYGERQRLSPILVRGEVVAVVCRGIECTLSMKIVEVLRNQSPRDIAAGSLVSIIFVGNLPSECHTPDSCLPPPIGAPVMSVEIPRPGDEKYAWLRPADSDGDTYELMAGQYGFGPNLESSE